MDCSQIGVVQEKDVIGTNLTVALKSLNDLFDRYTRACDVLAHGGAAGQYVPTRRIKRGHVIALLGGSDRASDALQSCAGFDCNVMEFVRDDFERYGMNAFYDGFHVMPL
jgi:hypothetical protein